MKFSSGILTARGGRLSHAALIARSWGKPCVVGCEGLEIAEDHIKLGDEVVPVGNLIKIDAESGEVFT
jgi:pyruvate,orthophosphate dikinase